MVASRRHSLRNNSRKKWLMRAFLGIVTFVPLIYFIWFVSTFIAAVSSPGPPAGMNSSFVVAHLVATLLNFSLIGYYILNVRSRNDWDSNRQRKWVAFLLLGNVFAMPLYWLKHYRYKVGGDVWKASDGTL